MLASTIKIPKLIDLAKKNKMQAVAITDKANLFGSLEFSIEASKNKIQPIHGMVINLKYIEDKEKTEFAEILIIAQNEVGYKNLLKLSSIPYLQNNRKYYEHISWDDLEKHSKGLIILSGYTDGPIGKEISKNNIEVATKLAKKFSSKFGDRFYFEIFRHSERTEILIEPQYLKLACDLDIAVVATNKVLFEDSKMHDAHDVLLCIAAGVTKDNQNRKFVSNQAYFKSSEEMINLFRDIPSAIENTIYISQRCSVKAEKHEPMLPGFSSNLTEEEYLRKLATEGLNARLANKFNIENITDKKEEITKEYFNRLEYELSIVLNMKFAGYFLIVSDFIKWSKENNINVGPGRGSGAGSIIAWSLLITDLDPIRFGLLFERFLNPERISMPDFDIDFCQERREEVINYVRQKYGDKRVAQIITFGKLQAKAVIKDVSRVLGLRYEIAEYLTELVPFNAVNPVTLEQALSDVAELKQAHSGKGLYNFDTDNELVKQVLDTALVLEGLNRHCSVHAAGIVISGTELLDIVPLYKDQNSDMSIIQYSMKYAELAGLVKFDFLGLQTLTVISKCLELLKKSGVNIELPTLKFDDKKTYEMLSKGASVGVFQFESVGMKDTLRKLRPDCIEDLMALGALYRPGPMDNIPVYIACKHGRQKPDYLHPMLLPILEETHGVIVYQEQVLEIAKILAGYSLGAADLLRRAMGKKIKSEMSDQERIFTIGAEKNGISKIQAKDIFASVAKFAGYGFNRAHAASYAVISYQTAYLKANYPVEFLVACLNLDIDDQDKINVFKEESRKLGIEIISPNVNKSRGLFAIEIENNVKKIIYGFGAIKNVTINFGDEIAKNREIFGEFKTVTDFVERLSGKLLTKKGLESIIKAGCFCSIFSNRRSLLENVQKLLAHSARFIQDKTTRQSNLFENIQKTDDIIDIYDDYDLVTKASMELEVLGLFVSYHPLMAYSERFKESNIRSINDLMNLLQNGSSVVKIAGVILRKDARMSARGRFITLLLSDPTGNIDVTIFSENTLKDYAHLIIPKTSVIVECEAFRDEGSIRLTASKFIDPKEYFNNITYDLKLSVSSYKELENIMNILEISQKSDQKSSKVEITLSVNSFDAKISFKSNHQMLKDELAEFQNKIDNKEK